MRLQIPQGTPQWDDGAEQRLFVSMSLATLLVVGALSLFRMPLVPAWSPVFELLVRIVREQPVEAETEPLQMPAPTAVPNEDASEGTAEPPPTMGVEALEPGRPGIDADALREQIVQEYMDRQIETYGYFNPALAEKRRSLSGRYQPGTHEKPKPIWENVEIDTLGRTVLRDGNCFKVLDDPNVGSREAFELFGQFVVQCTYQGRYPRELPWVAEIRPRYEYLRNPGGYEPDVP